MDLDFDDSVEEFRTEVRDFLTAHADAARDMSAAKVSAAEAGLLAARSALQTHGAIGFTQEHDLSLLLLRVQALRSAWGDPSAHRRRVLEAL